MHEFDNEAHKRKNHCIFSIRELAELESSKDDLRRMSTEDMKDEIEHVSMTIRLAEEAVEKGWYSLYICHKATIAAGMDLMFARLSANF